MTPRESAPGSGASPGDSLARARTACDAGDPWTAIELLRGLVDAGNVDARVHGLLGRCLASAGELEAAAEHCQRALELDPEEPRYRVHMAGVHMRAGEIPRALQQLRRALRRQPEDVDALVDYGVALWASGHLDDARRAFMDALRSDPDAAFARRNLALLQSGAVEGWQFAMVNDARRNERYEQALERVVDGDSVVLDVGAGTGLLSLMAARCGARRVIACEASPAMASVAREIVERNGYSDRVEVLAKSSRALDPERDLPARPNVMVAEVFDSEILGEDALNTFDDARRRLLAPNAVVIPRRAAVDGVLVQCEALWQEAGVETVAGFDLTPLHRYRRDTIPLEPKAYDAALLSTESELVAFDLSGEGEPTPPRTELELEINREGVCHALVYWIRLDLDGEASLDNRPDLGSGQRGSGGGHWYPLAKPLAAPLPVEAGTRLRVVAQHNRQNLVINLYRQGESKPLA